MKQFRPGPRSAEVKYFGRDFHETLKFADWTPDASAIIEVKIPKSILDEIGNFTPLDSTIFRKGTVMIEPENLDVFNKNMSGFYHIF